MDHGNIDSELTSAIKSHSERYKEYLISEVFPKREIHLIGGASGAGKTRWSFDLLMDWEKGIPVLGGRSSHPVPWIYISTDRSIDSVRRTFDHLSIPWGTINVIPARGKDNKSFRQIIDIADCEGAQMVYIEMLGKFVPAPGRDFQVENFLNECQAYTSPCSQFPEGLTFFGTKEEPKQSPKDKYANPRQRISGCAAWGHYCETIVFIDMDHPEEPTDPNRTIHVCPREKAIKFKAKFNNTGHLVICS